ncbi:MAG: hypothetical protein UW22_C0065G0006 [Candidatus Gottesmanbacteria bacterium GW2011_GWB1_44_11c]|uniref:Type II secretion system protein G n=2 Tax=Candidatus Gottesmaniibacteriota TaxID=1752720 RepID=A0A0G1KTX3_9BACT|nr:MAG: hypothetical protein UW22_C0065G0006 [Candidatus Gottesmanbacteria bacterium GW2011_GWB1_44_11c]KKT59777.1 MAG: hypothetical protein UW52_C0033G0005 [Candidatus Gottesmanbacteria bacterium GW2011_GWA1_44_24b]
MDRQKRMKKGFSFGELLIVVAIVALIALAVLMAYQTQVAKAHDATRKEHMKKFRIMFEDYYNDHNCYPTEAQWDACTCGSACFSPYMDQFLCDPVTRQKYYYYPFTNADGEVDTCLGYRLYAKFENKGDPDITMVGCSWVMGCGTDTRSAYNYGITIPGPLTDADFNPNATPTPTGYQYEPGCESATGPWACNIAGTCNSFASEDFSNGRCSYGFTTADCCHASVCPAITWCEW